jgi:hypothetical protein
VENGIKASVFFSAPLASAKCLIFQNNMVMRAELSLGYASMFWEKLQGQKIFSFFGPCMQNNK